MGLYRLRTVWRISSELTAMASTSNRASSSITTSIMKESSPVPLNGNQSLWERLFSWLPSWKPSSEVHLEVAENVLLQELNSEYQDLYVPISNDAVVRTVIMEPNAVTNTEQVPVVMIHGFGAGFLQFYKNLDHLHSQRRLLALDLPGFGRSTRIAFPSDAKRAEDKYVEDIEKWREGVGVEKFILLGHSFGAYLSCAYALQHPSRVRHLILVDPWGFPVPPSKEQIQEKYSKRTQLFWSMFSGIMPFTVPRLAGPWGPDIVKRMRSDLMKTFGESFLDYVYHCNAQKPTGEEAFYRMQYFYGWAQRPMITRVASQLDQSIPITVIGGSRSWMRFAESYQGARTPEVIRQGRRDCYVGVHYVEGAGHHVHADQPLEFNRIVNEVFRKVDSGEDIVSPLKQ